MENIFFMKWPAPKGCAIDSSDGLLHISEEDRIICFSLAVPYHLFNSIHHTDSRSMLLPLDGLDVTAWGEGEQDEQDMDVV